MVHPGPSFSTSMCGIIVIHTMNLAGIDLNLLVVLEALLAEASVTRAARRVGLSQPATSHALGRLRALLGDALFVRTPQGLRTTPRAEELRAPLAAALEAVRRTLAGPAPFDPRTSTRTFTLACADLAAFVLLPPLLARLAEAGPEVNVVLRPVAVADVARQLGDGELDLFLGTADRAFDALHAQPLFRERFLTLVRKGHPATRRRLDLDAFCAVPHLLVAPRGTPGSYVDTRLAELGRSRRVVLTLPQFLVAPHVVAATDLAWVAPERMVKSYSGSLPVVARPVPFELDGFGIVAYWHEREHKDAAHRWFRATLAGLAREV